MACPYCHATDHSSLGKCPRWTGRQLGKARDFTGTYGASLPAQHAPSLAALQAARRQFAAQAAAAEAMQAEAYRVLRQVVGDCPHCAWVQDSVAVCPAHTPMFREAVGL